MNSIDSLVGFLGKPVADSDFQQFLKDKSLDLKSLDSPEFTYTYYEFETLGFSIACNNVRECVISLDFHLRSPKVLDGAFSRYLGELPWGITDADKRDDVSRKLGSVPIRSNQMDGQAGQCGGESNYWSESYNLPPLTLEVTFTQPEEKLEMFALFYTALVSNPA